MIPCKFCKPSTTGAALRGLKQVGKTQYAGTRFERRYRCQDCDATCIMRGDVARVPSAMSLFDDEWSPPPGA